MNKKPPEKINPKMSEIGSISNIHHNLQSGIAF